MRAMARTTLAHPWTQRTDELVSALRLRMPVEALLLAAGGFWALGANGRFLSAALRGQDPAQPATWGLAAALVTLLVAVHFLMLAPWVTRRSVKPVLAVLLVATALATHAMQAYGLYLDPSMLRNVLHTDPAEARELLSWALARHLVLQAGLPLLLLTRIEVVAHPGLRGLRRRAGMIIAVLLAGLAALLLVFPTMASLMRNQREVRYLITPANYVWSVAANLARDARGATAPRQPIGTDAHPGPRMAARARPLVVVLVLGETARAANWGLNGYARQTTPALAAWPVVSFDRVTSCGTSTEVSVPCMFAPVGRRDYDEARIQGSQSLLHVLARAGVDVRWRDNQSGCKGVCDGLPFDEVSTLGLDDVCSAGRCLDEGLLHGLDAQLSQARGTQLIVLHQLGNHGPSYHRRYPPAFARFQPACDRDDLRECSREAIVNAYDNALLYTDHLLARLLTQLQSHTARVDTALLYVSDHGESLGENRLYLHGMPYAIAPAVQTQVPMLMWLSDGARQATGIDLACLRQRATQPASHDHLFHTLLGLMDVRTTLHDTAWDLTAGCRGPGQRGTS